MSKKNGWTTLGNIELNPKFLKGQIIPIPAQSNEVSYQFPAYMALFFNFCFFLCLSPIRVKREKGTYVLKTYFPHKVFCILFEICGVASSALLTKGAMALVDILKQPELIYDLFRRICTIVYTILLYYLLWFNSSKIANVLNLKPGLEFGNIKKRGLLLKCGLFLILFLEVSWVFVDDILSFGSFERWVSNMTSFVLSSVYMTPRPEQSFQESSGLEKGLVVALFSFYIYTCIVTKLTHIMILVSALAVREIVGNVKKKMIIMENPKEKVLALIRMREAIGTINEMSGPILLVLFADQLGLTAIAMGKQKQIQDWFQPTLFVLTYAVNIISFGVAAETHHKAVKMEKELIISSSFVGGKCQGAWGDLLQGVPHILAAAPGQNAMVGWKFFELSYSFLGTALSVCLTYTLVMLQFVATPKRAEAIDGQLETGSLIPQ